MASVVFRILYHSVGREVCVVNVSQSIFNLLLVKQTTFQIFPVEMRTEKSKHFIGGF